MAAHRRTVLFLPPNRTRIRLRVRVSLVVVLVLLSLIGFVGYFIPLNDLSADVVEQNQKKNLADQNEKLFRRIHGMRGMLATLGTEIENLENSRRSIAHAVETGTRRRRDTLQVNTFLSMNKNVDELLVTALSAEALLTDLTTMEIEGKSIWNSFPTIHPVGPEGIVTARFGEMRDPFTGSMKLHYGIDFAAPKGTPVIAGAEGKVVSTENHPTWGRRVVIRHPYGLTTVYAHLGSITVVKGAGVRKGAQIGTVGVSGLTTGPHLHYEIRRNGRPVDPEDYFFPEIPVLSGTAL